MPFSNSLCLLFLNSKRELEFTVIDNIKQLTLFGTKNNDITLLFLKEYKLYNFHQIARESELNGPGFEH